MKVGYKVKYFFVIAFVLVNLGFGNCQDFQLAPPQIKAVNSFYENSTTINLSFDMEGSEIYYRFAKDNKDKIYRYSRPIIIYEDCQLSFFAFHPDFLTSDTLSKEFHDVSDAINTSLISINPDPNKNYTGDNKNILFDKKRGSMNFRDGQWMGFLGSSVTMEFSSNDKIVKGELLIGLMQNTGAWIFGPQKIGFFAYNEMGNAFENVKNVKIQSIDEKDEPSKKLISIPFNLINATSRFKLEFEQTKEIPVWHSGSPDNVWIFIDEILVR